MNNAVTDSADLIHTCDTSVLGACECGDNGLHSIRMIVHGSFLTVFNTLDELLVLYSTAFDADTVTVALCEYCFVLHIEELIFERTASCIYYKNFH